MQIKCTKCQKVILISDEKLPTDKEKAMVKCPSCQQTLVFVIPRIQKQQVANSDRTIIEQVHSKVLKPRLVEINTGTEYNLPVGKNILGRNAMISIPNDRFISHQHCMIEVLEHNGQIQCIISDDGSFNASGKQSTNGTFLNDRRLNSFDKLFLNPGDKIMLGHTDFIYKTE